MILNQTLLLVGAGVAAWLLALLAERLGRLFRLVDTPGDPLKIHTRATPRFGGLAIIITLWLTFIAARAIGAAAFSVPELLSATLLFVLGTWDDFKPRSALVRLLLQAAIFAHAWALGIRMNITGMPWLDCVMAYGVFAVVVNGVNFYDGMDGLLSLSAASALGIWAAVSADLDGVWYPFALAAVILLGFLPRNWHPARTFLGDGGSFIVGFLFYLVFVRSQVPGPQWMSGFWVAAVPVCDAVAATIDRLSLHGNVLVGDRDHVYDILGRLGLSASQVALLLGLLAAMTARGTKFVASMSKPESAFLTVVLYAVMILFILALRRRFGLESDRRPRRA